jgi:hypothetical protein
LNINVIMISKIILLINLVITISFVSEINAQEYFRISADFTTKTKRAEGKSNLTRGRVFYDKFTKELIYDIHFPENEKWVVQKSWIYKLVNDSVYFSEELPSINEFTVFHLSLNSNLAYFGLNEAQFSIGKVDKIGDLVVSYWNIPPHIQKMISSIAIAQKDNSLHSVVIAGEDKEVASKQFFRDYIKIGGFEFPGTIIQISYDMDRRENYQVMEFKNIVLNDTENEENYHYKLGEK